MGKLQCSHRPLVVLKGFASQQRNGRAERAGGNGRVREKNGREGKERPKGRRQTLSPLARIPAGAHDDFCKTTYNNY